MVGTASHLALDWFEIRVPAAEYALHVLGVIGLVPIGLLFLAGYIGRRRLLHRWHGDPPLRRRRHVARNGDHPSTSRSVSGPHHGSTPGLTVEAVLDTNTYPTATKVTKAQYNVVPLTRHQFHGDWNYTVHSGYKPETAQGNTNHDESPR